VGQGGAAEEALIGVKVWKATFAEMAFTAYSLLLLALAAIVLWEM
jgi:hypothetical protein